MSNKVTVTIDVPSCWRDLIDVVFAADLEGVKSEKCDHRGIHDPDPHYDDVREVSAIAGNGSRVLIALMSGQSNYYGGMQVYSAAGDLIYDSEPWEDYGDVEVVASDGVTYDVKVRFVTDDR